METIKYDKNKTTESTREPSNGKCPTLEGQQRTEKQTEAADPAAARPRCLLEAFLRPHASIKCI